MSPALAALDGSPELYDQVRLRIIRPGGLYYFTKGICGFPDLTVRCHGPVCAFLEDKTHTSKLLEYPRKHLKTTIATVARTLWIFACRVVQGEDPVDRVGIASSTKENAMRFLRLIAFIPEQNILFQNFLPELLPEFSNEDVWNRHEIIFPRNVAFTDPSVDTIGAGGKPASRHYTWFVEDDMVNEENWDSPGAIKKAVELHQLYEGLMVTPEDPRLVCENSWTDYDLNRHIVDNEPDTAVLSVGCTGGLNTNRSRHLPESALQVMRTWDLDDESIWPERMNVVQLLRMRKRVGARIYNAQFENQPFDPDVVDFREDWLRYYEWTADGNIRIPIQPGHKEIEIVKLIELHRVAAYDPALSTKTDADRSALVVHGVDPISRVFQLECIAQHSNPLPFMDLVYETCLKWGVERCAVEKVLFQRILIDLLHERADAFNARMEAEHKDARVFAGMFEPIGPDAFKRLKGSLSGAAQAKIPRIRALIGTAFEQGKVYIHASQVKFVDEYLHFPIGKTRDILDAFAYAASLWAPGESEEMLIEAMERESNWLAQRDAVTGY
jgi:hypothetical protein